jgi:hypothetical protein
MIFILGLILASIIVVIMMKRAGRRGGLIGTRGVSSVRMCPDEKCGLPAGKCQHLRRQAEGTAAFRGSIRKK